MPDWDSTEANSPVPKTSTCCDHRISRLAVHIQGVFRWHLVVRDHEATKKGLVGCSPMEMATSPNLISGVIFDAQTAWSNVWRPKWEAWKHAGCLIMIDFVGTCGNMWEHVGTCGNMWEPTHATSNWCFAFWFPRGPKNGSYGPCKLQVLILQETRQAIGEERWTQTRKALPRCFKDDSPNPSIYLSGQDKIRRSIYCHVSVHFIALFPALNILSSPIEVELSIGISSHPRVGNGQLTSVSGHRAITRCL